MPNHTVLTSSNRFPYMEPTTLDQVESLEVTHINLNPDDDIVVWLRSYGLKDYCVHVGTLERDMYVVRLTMEGRTDKHTIYIARSSDGRVVDEFDVEYGMDDDQIIRMVQRIRMAYEMPEEFTRSLRIHVRSGGHG